MAHPPRPGRLWLFAVAVLGVAVAVNLGSPVAAVAALKGYLATLMPSRGMDVRIVAWPPIALWWGRMDLLAVAAHDAQIGTLQMEEFDATFSDLRFDPEALLVHHTLVISALRVGIAHGTISQAELLHALALQPNVRVDSVVLQPGRVFLKGAVRVLGAELPAQGVGHLVLNGDTAVDLVLDHVAAGGGPLPTSGPSVTLKSVLSVPSLPFGFHLTGVRTGDGRLVLDAGMGPS